jgi:DNA-binding IclR family transcriptional regulator
MRSGGNDVVTKEVNAGTQALERAISLLDCFSEDNRELRVLELCALTQLNQSTVSRMMSALDRTGYVVQDPRTGLYRLGPAAVSLGTVALNSSPIYGVSRQIAQNLAHRTGLGVNVAELRDSELRYLGNFEGPRAPKSFSMAGRTGPLHATGMGKALLATMDAEALKAYFAQDLPRFTPRTIVVRKDMDQALEEIRNRGYATEIEELAFGRACIAAAIRDRSGAGVAALSVSGPLSAFDEPGSSFEDLARQVVETADEISIALGFSPSSIRFAGASNR